MKVFNQNSIRKILSQHAKHYGTVYYSDDDRNTWKRVPVDTGKWKHNWEYIILNKLIKEKT